MNILDIFKRKRKLFVSKKEYEVKCNRCIVSKVETGRGQWSVLSRPGPNELVTVQMYEADVNDWQKRTDALKLVGIDTYYVDVLYFKDKETGIIVFEKNIRDYYADLPEEEFIKAGFAC